MAHGSGFDEIFSLRFLSRNYMKYKGLISNDSLKVKKISEICASPGPHPLHLLAPTGRSRYQPTGALTTLCVTAGGCRSRLGTSVKAWGCRPGGDNGDPHTTPTEDCLALSGRYTGSCPCLRRVNVEGPNRVWSSACLLRIGQRR